MCVCDTHRTGFEHSMNDTFILYVLEKVVEVAVVMVKIPALSDDTEPVSMYTGR